MLFGRRAVSDIMEFVLLISVFAVFIPALMLPGPDFVAVARSALTRGTAAGICTAIGVSLGLGFYACVSLLGLSAILVQYEWLAWTVRALGGCYLLYLGIRLLQSKPERIDVPVDGEQATGNAVLFGFLVTLTNPKAIVLFASVFATAVTSQTSSWLMMVMIALVVITSLSWYSLLSLLMSSPAIISRFEHSQQWIERIAGVCFIAFAGRILADGRGAATP